jgi:hypothetical protein
MNTSHGFTNSKQAHETHAPSQSIIFNDYVIHKESPILTAQEQLEKKLILWDLDNESNNVKVLNLVNKNNTRFVIFAVKINRTNVFFKLPLSEDFKCKSIEAFYDKQSEDINEEDLHKFTSTVNQLVTSTDMTIIQLLEHAEYSSQQYDYVYRGTITIPNQNYRTTGPAKSNQRTQRTNIRKYVVTDVTEDTSVSTVKYYSDAGIETHDTRMSSPDMHTSYQNSLNKIDNEYFCNSPNNQTNQNQINQNQINQNQNQADINNQSLYQTRIPQWKLKANHMLKGCPENILTKSRSDIVDQLIGEIIMVKTCTEDTGINVDPIDDNIFNLSIKLTDFEEGESLHNDMYGLYMDNKYKYIELELIINMSTYPYAPPEIQLVRPKLTLNTCYNLYDLDCLKKSVHNARQGSRSGWHPQNTLLHTLAVLKVFLQNHGKIESNPIINSLDQPKGSYLDLETYIMRLYGLIGKIPHNITKINNYNHIQIIEMVNEKLGYNMDMNIDTTLFKEVIETQQYKTMIVLLGLIEVEIKTYNNDDIRNFINNDSNLHGLIVDTATYYLNVENIKDQEYHFSLALFKIIRELYNNDYNRYLFKKRYKDNKTLFTIVREIVNNTKKVKSATMTSKQKVLSALIEKLYKDLKNRYVELTKKRKKNDIMLHKGLNNIKNILPV